MGVQITYNDIATDLIFDNITFTNKYFQFHPGSPQTMWEPEEPAECEIYYTAEVNLKDIGVTKSKLKELEKDNYFRSQAASVLVRIAEENDPKGEDEPLYSEGLDIDPEKDIDLEVKFEGDKIIIETTLVG